MTCVPPLCEKAAAPTHGSRGFGRTLAVSSRNCDSSFSCASDSGGTDGVRVLELQNRHDAGQVAVAGPLAVAVERALDVRRAGVDRGQRVGDAEPDVVVRVDAEPRLQVRAGVSRQLGDLGRQRPAVGVAERDDVGAGAFGRLPGCERVLAVVLAAVEGVLGVVDHELAVLLQEAHGVADHREVLFRRRLQHLDERAAATSCRRW